MGARVLTAGDLFGRWTVLNAKAFREKSGKTRVYLFECKCSCGTVKNISKRHLVTGVSKSCGCLRRELLTKPSGFAELTSIYARYRTGAANRNLSFNIPIETFKELSKLECHYCGAAPSNVSNTGDNTGTYVYNGMDRVDNSKGYEIDNVVAACGNYNLAKRTMTKESFLSLAKRIYERHFK